MVYISINDACDRLSASGSGRVTDFGGAAECLTSMLVLLEVLTRLT